MKRWYFLGVLVVMVISIGCQRQKKPSNLPELSPLTIEIKQDGKPLPGASVTMMLAEGVTKWPAAGLTNEQGKAKLAVNGVYKGVAEGDYKVVVMKTVTDGKEEPGKARPTLYSLVNLDYSKGNTTPLTAKVTKETKEFSFDVGKPVKVLVPSI